MHDSRKAKASIPPTDNQTGSEDSVSEVEPPKTRRIRRFDPVTRVFKFSEVELGERRFESGRYYSDDGKLITGE